LPALLSSKPTLQPFPWQLCMHRCQHRAV
jgi:hypothetical protein